MLLLYARTIPPRFEYTANLLLRELVGMDFILTTDETELREADGPKINYSSKVVKGAINICPNGLLFDDKITAINPTTGKWGKLSAMFMSPEGYGLPFDIFTAAFYLVSRYEEYLPFKPDNLGRFTPEESILHKLGTLDKPIVNRWALKFRKMLLKAYPKTEYKKTPFRFITTLDIDMAFKYRHKGFLRNAGGVLRDTVRLRAKSLIQRRRVLSGVQKDPFDNFKYQYQVHNKFNADAVYFFQVGQRSRYDKNISIQNPEFRDIISKTAQYHCVGIHPSMLSHHEQLLLKEEVDDLAQVIQKPVLCSRQHFLMLRFPDTYRQLMAFGIDEDYTMGYSNVAGFRAGICTPYMFFDLERNRPCSLRVFPFAIMDVTMQHFYALSPKNAGKLIQRLMKRVKRAEGTFIGVFHNESLSEQNQWKGWRSVYETMLAEGLKYTKLVSEEEEEEDTDW